MFWDERGKYFAFISKVAYHPVLQSYVAKKSMEEEIMS
jgi:hypothetical protein